MALKPVPQSGMGARIKKSLQFGGYFAYDGATGEGRIDFSKRIRKEGKT